MPLLLLTQNDKTCLTLLEGFTIWLFWPSFFSLLFYFGVIHPWLDSEVYMSRTQLCSVLDWLLYANLTPIVRGIYYIYQLYHLYVLMTVIPGLIYLYGYINLHFPFPIIERKIYQNSHSNIQCHNEAIEPYSNTSVLWAIMIKCFMTHAKWELSKRGIWAKSIAPSIVSEAPALIFLTTSSTLIRKVGNGDYLHLWVCESSPQSHSRS